MGQLSNVQDEYPLHLETLSRSLVNVRNDLLALTQKVVYINYKRKSYRI
jgi:hypothetical protein